MERRTTRRTDRSSTHRAARVAGAAVFAGVAIGALGACDPGGLSNAAVAFTTDQSVTTELQRRHADVRRLDCTGTSKDDDAREQGGSRPSASEDTVVRVDCQGETGDGKDIAVAGRITRAVSGACVRGDLVAEIDGRRLFHVHGLGDCDARPAPGNPGGGPPGPTVTVTVTRTVYCEQRPGCWPDGK